MPALLLYGDTERSAALRHEVPIVIGDPFVWAEVDGRVALLASPLEGERMAAALPDARLVTTTELGFYKLLESGKKRWEIELELVSRMVRELGVTEALVDTGFPLGAAERLRADGVTLTVDHEGFPARRRVTSPAEMAGIERAQRAAEAGMAAAAAMLRAAEPGPDGLLHLDGEVLIAERVRAARRLREGGRAGPAGRHRRLGAPGLRPRAGDGPVACRPADPGRPVAARRGVGLLGGHDAHVRRGEGAGGRPRPGGAHPRGHGRGPGSMPPRRPGTRAARADLRRLRGRRAPHPAHGPRRRPVRGLPVSLGHGIGLEVHEAQGMGQAGRDPLVTGDVLAVEPGLWEREVGGVRFEDLLLVTEDGCETLTRYPYDLTPWRWRWVSSYGRAVIRPPSGGARSGLAAR